MWNRSFSFVPRYQLREQGKCQISKSPSLFARKVPTENAAGSQLQVRTIPYGYIPTWKKHQYIGKSERKTKFSFPAPEGVVDEPDADETREEPLPNGTETVSKPFEPRRGKVMGMGKENVMENVNGAASRGRWKKEAQHVS